MVKKITRSQYKNFPDMYLASNLKAEKKKRNDICSDIYGEEFEYDPSIDVYKDFRTVYELEDKKPFSLEQCVKTQEFDKTTDKLKRYYPNIRNEFQCRQVQGFWNPKAINRVNFTDDGTCFKTSEDARCSHHDRETIIKARQNGEKSLTSYEYRTQQQCSRDKTCEWYDNIGECITKDAMERIYEVMIPKLPSNWPVDITKRGFQQYLYNYYSRMYDVIPQKHMSIFGTGNRCTNQKPMISKPQTVINMIFKAMAKNPRGSNRGLLVYHGVGSGKLCTATAVMEAFWDVPKKNIVFLSSIEGIASNPPSVFYECATRYLPRFKQVLQDIPEDQHMAKIEEMFKERNVRFFTFAQLAHYLLIANPLKVKPDQEEAHRNFLKNSILIIDEVHNIFKPLPHQRFEHTALKKFLSDPNNKYIENMNIAVLTATPGDTPEDVVELINFVRDKRAPLIKVPNMDDPKSVKEFSESISGLISYFDVASDVSKYPRVLYEKPHMAPMSMTQYTKYIEALTDTKTDEKDLEKLEKEDKVDRYYKAARKYSNMLFNMEPKMQLKEFSSKLPLLIENIKKYPNEKHYIYSTFFENRGYGGQGILAIAKTLEKELKYEKIDYKQARAFNHKKDLPKPKKRYMLAITNELKSGGAPPSRKEKQKIPKTVNEHEHDKKHDSVGDHLKELTRLYNHPANKNGDYIHVFLASQKYNEGVDFKAIRHIHIFEPFLSFNKENQTIGRGSRYCSHYNLDIAKGEWTVKIHKYIADFPIEVKQVDLGQMRSFIAANKEVIADNERHMQELKGKRGKEYTEERNDLKAAISKAKADLADVSKQLKKMEILDTSKYFMIDQKIEEEVKEKVIEMNRFNTLLKSAAVDCKLFRQFHAQTGNIYTCLEGDK